MGNSKASSVAPLPEAERRGSLELGPGQAVEQARDFHFAVTWIGLFAQLDPIPAIGPWRSLEDPGPAPTLALVPVVVSPPIGEQRADQESSAAWEMVVPKMIRTGPRTFIPADGKLP